MTNRYNRGCKAGAVVRCGPEACVAHILGGPWVVKSGVIIRVIMIVVIVRVLRTLLATSPSSPNSVHSGKGLHKRVSFESKSAARTRA